MSLRRARQPEAGEAASLAGVLPVAAAPFVVSCVAVSLVRDPGRHPLLFYGSMSIAFLSLFGCLCWWWRRERRPSWRQMLFVAVISRLLFLSLPPTLSEDVFRYLWDGRVTTAGFNPYAHSPDSDRLAPLREDEWEGIWRQTEHRGIPTVYPPVAIGIFSIAALSPSPLLVYRLILTALELLGCLLLIRWAESSSPVRGRLSALAYVWNPLALLEVAGMGHIDGAGLAPMVLAVAWLTETPDRRAPLASATAAVTAILVKLVPLVAVPFWALTSGRAGRYLGAVTVLLLLVLVPVLLPLGGAPPGLVTYGVSWEFNGPLFEPLWRLFDLLALDDAVKVGMDRAGGASRFPALYPYAYPQFLAKLALAAGFLVWLGTMLCRERDPARGTRRILGGAMLAMATVYPWYLLWVLPWAAVTRSLPWIVASVTILLAYLPRLFGATYFPWVWMAVWGPVLVVALAQWLSRSLGVPESLGEAPRW